MSNTRVVIADDSAFMRRLIGDVLTRAGMDVVAIVANGREAMREIALDIEEGADMIIIKPALTCLDVIHAARSRFDVPIAAYHVSGESAMIRAAGQLGALDAERMMLESLVSIKRAGADMIITYSALDAIRLL